MSIKVNGQLQIARTVEVAQAQKVAEVFSGVPGERKVKKTEKVEKGAGAKRAGKKGVYA